MEKEDDLATLAPKEKIGQAWLTMARTVNIPNSGSLTWTPDGSIGSGVVGGTESADAENLNSTFAALPGQSLTHSDPYGAGVFGHYAAMTNALAAGNYTLSFTMTEATDVNRVDASTVPEPATYLLVFVGLGFMGAMGGSESDAGPRSGLLRAGRHGLPNVAMRSMRQTNSTRFSSMPGSRRP